MTCLAMPRHSSIIERSHIAFSIRIFLETAPAEAANSATSWRSAKAGEAAWPCVHVNVNVNNLLAVSM